ncbi:MAG: hypothetical protein M3O70_06310 [Actinomycetota bacterium]|nr:hypothetical protein [Actinomycetota bacterium]
MALPLTRQLRTDGDLRRWFEARFRHLDAVAHDVPPRLRCLVRRRTADGIPPWLMGMAFDWRLRLGLEVPADPWTTTAFAGWMLAFGDGLDGALHQQPLDDPVTALLDHAHTHGAGGGAATDRDEFELARISVALALYESWYRGGVRPGDPLHRLGPVPDIADLTTLCPPAAAEEMTHLVGVARRGLAPLFPASSIETNPVLDAHGIPADGDLILDGLLLDLKTVTRPQLQLDWLWQMIGYVLLDGGRRQLHSVGIYLSRHGWLHRWSLPDLLSRLAGKPVKVHEARQDFLSSVCAGDVDLDRAAESAAATWDAAPTAPWVAPVSRNWPSHNGLSSGLSPMRRPD